MKKRDNGGGFGRSGRRGLGGGYVLGPGGECICTNCNYRENHQKGDPCHKKECPQCETPLTRQSIL
ncbi:MAG: hypothetical protein V5A68_07345 [Candidatus Thermoplasmatota archaeon]